MNSIKKRWIMILILTLFTSTILTQTGIVLADDAREGESGIGFSGDWYRPDPPQPPENPDVPSVPDSGGSTVLPPTGGATHYQLMGVGLGLLIAVVVLHRFIADEKVKAHKKRADSSLKELR